MNDVITKVYDFQWNLLTLDEFNSLKIELLTNKDIEPIQVTELNTELYVSYLRLKTKIIINWEEIFSSKTKLVPIILKDRNDIIYYGNDKKKYLSEMNVYKLNKVADSVIKILNKSELFNILFKLKFVHIILSAFYDDSIIKKRFDYIKYSTTDYKLLFNNFEKEFNSKELQENNNKILEIIENKELSKIDISKKILLFSKKYEKYKTLFTIIVKMYNYQFLNHPNILSLKKAYICKLYELHKIPESAYVNKKNIKIFLDYLENISDNVVFSQFMV